MDFDTLYELAMDPSKTAEAIQKIKEGIEQVKAAETEKEKTITENNRMIGELNKRLFMLQTGKMPETETEKTAADELKERFADYFKEV